MLLSLLFLGLVAADAPNDLCQNATMITDGTVMSFNDINSTSQTSCMNADVFFVYTATCSGTAVIVFQAPAFDIKVAAFTGSDCSTRVLSGACVDQTASGGSETLQFSVISNTNYYLAAGSYNTGRGNFSVTVTCNAAPLNDRCEGALSISPGVTIQANNTWATSQSSCAPFDIYFSYIATCTGTSSVVFASLTNSIRGVLFTGSSCATLGNEIFCTTAPTPLQFATTAGQTYYFAVGATSSYMGAINVSVACFPPPPYDTCQSALALSSDTVAQVNNTWALSQTQCLKSDIYFSYSASCTGLAVAMFTPVSSGSISAVAFNGSTCASLSEGTCTNSGPAPTLQIPVIAGQTYYVAVGTTTGYQGAINAIISCHVSPANDACTGALQLTTNNMISANNTWATKQTQCLNSDIFFSYVASCTGTAIAAFTSVSAGSIGAVLFSGSTCAALGNENICSTSSPTLLNFAVTSGQTYYMAAGTTTGYQGAINVNITCNVPPSNDLCTTALAISDGVTQAQNRFSTTQLTSCTANDIFFSYTAICTGTVVAIFRATGGATLQAVLFSGSTCTSNTQCVSTTPATLSFPSQTGQTYYFATGSSGYQGDINVTVTCHPPPSNDLCTGATEIGNGVTQSSNSYANRESMCAYSADIFFAYTANCTGTATAIFTTPSASTLQVVQYNGSSCSTLGSELNCNTNNFLQFPVLNGQKYYMAAGSYYSNYQGTINVSTSCNLAPSNDMCSGAMPLSDGQVVSSTTAYATKQSSCISSADIFFSYTATCAGIAMVSFTTPTYAYLQVVGYSSNTCAALGNELGCISNNQPTYSMAVTIGQNYFIAVGSSASANAAYRGVINATVQCFKAPANDLCVNAMPISDGVILSNNTYSSKEVSCMPDNDIFFSYTATCTGTAVATFPTSIYLYIAYVSSCNTSASASCSSGSSVGYVYQLPTPVISGQSYLIAVGAASSYRGLISFTMTCHAAPPSDTCTGAIPVTDGSFVANNVWATRQATCLSQDVFFAYTPTCTGAVTIGFFIAGHNGVIGYYVSVAAYSGSTCTTLGSETCSQSSDTSLSYPVVLNQKLYFAVGSNYNDYSSFSGDINLTISCVPAPPNDLCTGATSVTDGSLTVSNVAANKGTTCIQQADVFLSYTATCTGTALAVFTGDNYADLQAVQVNGTCSAFNEAQCSSSSYSVTLHIAVVTGQRYLMAVGSYSSYRGNIVTTLSCSTNAPTRTPTTHIPTAPTLKGPTPFSFTFPPTPLFTFPPTPNYYGGAGIGGPSLGSSRPSADGGLVAGLFFLFVFLGCGGFVYWRRTQQGALSGTAAHHGAPPPSNKGVPLAIPVAAPAQP